MPLTDPSMTEVSSSASSPTPTPENENSLQESQESIEIPESANQNPANPLTPLLIASGIVTALIIIVILFKLR